MNTSIERHEEGRSVETETEQDKTRLAWAVP